MFQSPNGVQIAFLRESIVSVNHLFQSPNGVQIALRVSSRLHGILKVSITKRCTDCFIYICAIMILLLIVSITKRCTDCFTDISDITITLPDHCFNHQTVYRLLFCRLVKADIIISVSITKRCTDCFEQCLLCDNSETMSFNHQTVYRLLLLVSVCYNNI